ncbi:MAG: YhbY family RNA-binding protein [Myxococcota bacterium]|nr:YhbY family RNA-binding protein [Myxococcota bacterium]
MTQRPQTALEGFQRKHLRKLAHPLKPVVHVGAAGISETVLGALEKALADHELVKVRLHLPADKKSLARSLSQRSGAELCGLVGHTVILYLARPEEPRIELPLRD